MLSEQVALRGWKENLKNFRFHFMTKMSSAASSFCLRSLLSSSRSPGSFVMQQRIYVHFAYCFRFFLVFTLFSPLPVLCTVSSALLKSLSFILLFHFPLHHSGLVLEPTRKMETRREASHATTLGGSCGRQRKWKLKQQSRKCRK
jgi:hypothetical protein